MTRSRTRQLTCRSRRSRSAPPRAPARRPAARPAAVSPGGVGTIGPLPLPVASATPEGTGVTDDRGGDGRLRAKKWTSDASPVALRPGFGVVAPDAAALRD